MSQADALKALQTELDHSVHDFKSRFVSVSNRVRTLNHAKRVIYTRLGEFEQLKAQLKAEVKVAEEEEKYERAADLNAKIDATQSQIDDTMAHLLAAESDIEHASREKIEILKHFHALELSRIAQLSQLELAQNSVIKHYDRVVSDLENEATTVYASKIEMLNERLSDVEAELARSSEREQKIEAKIAANSQGLAESLQEDAEAIKTLTLEIQELRSQLAAKEAALSTIQSRKDINQEKMNALRKDQGAYLDDVVQEKQKKEETVKILRIERSTLESLMNRHHVAIENERALQRIEMEVKNSIGEVSVSMGQMAEASQQSIDSFSKPLLDIETHQSSTESLESLKSDLNNAKLELDRIKETIVLHNAALKSNRSELDNARNSLPLLEQSKQAAVATRDYKEAARIKMEIANTQAALETLAQNGETLAKQLHEAQSSLISQQSTITALMDQLNEQEAKNATGRMERITETKYAARLALQQLIDQPSEISSVLHDAATTVSIAQLEGMIDALEGEQKYLSIRFGLPIPEDKPLPEIQVLEELLQQTENNEESEKDEEIANEDDVEKVEKSEKEDEVKIESESQPIEDGVEEAEMDSEHQVVDELQDSQGSGLFDGLNASDFDDSRWETYTPPVSSVPGLLDDDPRKKELESELAALEAEVKQAVEEEDYDRADELNNKLVAVQNAISSLTL